MLVFITTILFYHSISSFPASHAPPLSENKKPTKPCKPAQHAMPLLFPVKTVVETPRNYYLKMLEGKSKGQKCYGLEPIESGLAWSSKEFNIKQKHQWKEEQILPPDLKQHFTMSFCL